MIAHLKNRELACDVFGYCDDGSWRWLAVEFKNSRKDGLVYHWGSISRSMISSHSGLKRRTDIRSFPPEIRATRLYVMVGNGLPRISS